MSSGSPPPTIQRLPLTCPFCGVASTITFVVSTASGPNTDSTACAVISFSIDAGINGSVGCSLNTMRPLTATVRHRESGPAQQIGEMGNEPVVGNRRAISGHAPWREPEWSATTSVTAAAAAFSACATTETPERPAMTRTSGATYHSSRRAGSEFSRGLAVGGGGRTPTGAKAR